MKKCELSGGYILYINGDIFNKRGRRIKTVLTTQGYIKIILSTNGVKKTYLLHRLLACNFIPAIPGKNVVNHKDGIKYNNSICNLEWVTTKENISHAHLHGLMHPPSGDNHWTKTSPHKIIRGEKCSIAKLTESEVKEIKKTHVPWDRNYSERALARKYNVSQGCIADIIKGDNWRHVCV